MEENTRPNSNCPCDAVKKIQESVEEHNNQLTDGKVQFAVINSKLSLILGVLAAVGVAVCGVIVNMLFK